MEKILNKPVAILVQTSKVVATGKDRKPIYENHIIPIVLNDWFNWIKYVGMHGFESVEVVGLGKNDKRIIGNQLSKDELSEVKKYQAEIDAVINPIVIQKDDTKAQLEAQKQANAELLKRLEALELLSKPKGGDKIAKLKAKYVELYGSQPHHNIKEDGLIDKIKEKLDPSEFSAFESEL